MSASQLGPGEVAQLACILEATARKPGNVHRFRDFEDSTYLDFIMSAQAIAGPLGEAATTGLGEAILRAVRATRDRVGSNTNLGMILLLAPLCLAYGEGASRPSLARVLRATTVDDARRAFRAIREASPGGLGTAADQDVASEPTVTFRDAMALAADRDSVARQYVRDYEDVYELGLPALAGAIRSGRTVEEAVILASLRLMAAVPDTLIARKRGRAEAVESAGRAAEVLRLGWPDAAEGRREFEALDAWLRAAGHSRNPGTTADLVSAALFLALVDGTIRLPLTVKGPAWSSPD